MAFLLFKPRAMELSAGLENALDQSIISYYKLLV